MKLGISLITLFAAGEIEIATGAALGVAVVSKVPPSSFLSLGVAKLAVATGADSLAGVGVGGGCVSFLNLWFFRYSENETFFGGSGSGGGGVGSFAAGPGAGSAGGRDVSMRCGDDE